MKRLFTLISTLVFFASISNAQQAGQIFGVNFQTSSLKLATVDPSDGNVTLISEDVMTADEFGSGNSDMNPNDNLYHYVRFGQIISADIITGEVVHSPTLFCETQQISAVQGISNIAYNWADSTIYGLVLWDQQVSFASVDYITGEITILSDGPISSAQFSSGVSDIDPVNSRYFYIRANRIITVDIASAEIIENEPIFNPNDAVAPITNIAYDWLSNVLYGINFVSSVWDNNGNTIEPAQLRLSVINPLSGAVIVLSESVLSADEFSSGVSDIDPLNQVYYYIRANRIYSVDILTGDLIESHTLSNPNGAIAPITNIAVLKDKDSFPNPVSEFEDNHSGQEVWFKNISSYTVDSQWDFGDGEVSTKRHPSHTYEVPGSYTVTLNATSLSGEVHSYSKTITIDAPLSISDDDANSVRIFPNPTEDYLRIDIGQLKNAQTVQVFSIEGKLVLQRTIPESKLLELDMNLLESGVYSVTISDQNGPILSEKIIKN